ncbi:MAG: aminotransferase class I/II-fold pyridoxal phosphate-dependent enzyme [Cyclobacteriaceae bacterium]|nr:aminotransferase class I/II-fold pyridoxal phosphate-dependent enzyme [Cyclobacteriaceae bacterium]
MQINRRQWLKSAGLAGSVALLGGLPSLSTAEQRKFNPRQSNGTILLNSNENPYGPSARVQEAIKKGFDIACRYPFAYSRELEQMIAEKEGVPTDHIVICGGSTEGLKVTGITFTAGGGEIIAAQPTFLSMMEYAGQWGASINWVPVDKDMQHDLDEMEKRISSKTRLIFLCNPNNPTSTLLPAQRVLDFCQAASKKTIVFSDEAYYDFIEEPNYPSMVQLVKQGRDVIVSRTFSKVYGLAGLRIGYLIARPALAEKIRNNIVAYTNVLAIEAARAALVDKEFYSFSLQKNREAKQLITKVLDEMNLNYLTSHTNFVFFHTGRDIKTLQQQMKAEGVHIGRPFPPFTDWCRISTGTVEEIQLFAQTLQKVMG